MKKLLSNILLILALCCSVSAQPDTLWTRTYGGTGDENGYNVQLTSDGGFITVGTTQSSGERGKDIYVVKTDVSGDTIWTKNYGGNLSDWGKFIQPTSDEGYIIAGYTSSYGNGSRDIYLLKTDENGDTTWTRTFGGDDYEWGECVRQTIDDGFIICGTTWSFGAGDRDVYLVKTDANGDSLWTKTIGGPQEDYGRSIEQTSDGGFIITGYTQSYGMGGFDVYLIRTESNGDTIWTRTYGRTGNDYGRSVLSVPHGGFLVAGYTYSFTDDNSEIYLIKVDTEGDTVWTKTLGGEDDDFGYDVQNTSDEGWIISGSTYSYGAGESDVFLIKADSDGNLEWNATYGGTGFDQGFSVKQTLYDGYIIGGSTDSFGAGQSDLYVIRLEDVNYAGGYGGHEPDDFLLIDNYPNPFNQSTAISYQLKTKSYVNLMVYDMSGREIAKLMEGEMNPGSHDVIWDAEGLSSGMYFAVLNAGEYTQTQKMVLMK